MKTVFMGTPEFAASILKALKEAGHEVTAVYTQPDKPQGRSGALIAPPVKVYAEENGIPVYQPAKIKAPESVEVLKTIPAAALTFTVPFFPNFAVPRPSSAPLQTVTVRQASPS